MKTYKIYAWRTNYGYYEVEAKDKEEAELKAHQKLWNGEPMDAVRDQDASTEEVELVD